MNRKGFCMMDIARKNCCTSFHLTIVIKKNRHRTTAKLVHFVNGSKKYSTHAEFNQEFVMARLQQTRNQYLTIYPGELSCRLDRKSTRLNSSHTVISYAVFCLNKKKMN